MKPVHVGFIVNKVAMGQVFLQELQVCPVSNSQPMVHIHSFIHSPIIEAVYLRK